MCRNALFWTRTANDRWFIAHRSPRLSSLHIGSIIYILFQTIHMTPWLTRIYFILSGMPTTCTINFYQISWLINVIVYSENRCFPSKSAICAFLLLVPPAEFSTLVYEVTIVKLSYIHTGSSSKLPRNTFIFTHVKMLFVTRIQKHKKCSKKLYCLFMQR